MMQRRANSGFLPLLHVAAGDESFRCIRSLSPLRERPCPQRGRCGWRGERCAYPRDGPDAPKAVLRITFGGFPADSGERFERLARFAHLPAVALDEQPAGLEDVLRLGAITGRCADMPDQSLLCQERAMGPAEVSATHSFSVREIHALVGCLRRVAPRHQQLARAGARASSSDGDWPRAAARKSSAFLRIHARCRLRAPRLDRGLIATRFLSPRRILFRAQSPRRQALGALPALALCRDRRPPRRSRAACARSRPRQRRARRGAMSMPVHAERTHSDAFRKAASDRVNIRYVPRSHRPGRPDAQSSIHAARLVDQTTRAACSMPFGDRGQGLRGTEAAHRRPRDDGVAPGGH